MAVAVTPAAPGAFSFLKHGVALPSRRFGLFMEVFAMDAVLYVASCLYAPLVTALAPFIAAAAGLESHGVSPVDAAAIPDSIVMCAGAAYVVLCLAATAARKAAIASAAVASYSGEPHTVGSFLRRVRDNVARGAATVALGWALHAASGAAAILIWDLSLPALMLLPVLVLTLLLFAFSVYLVAVCAVAVVASAAETGRRGAGAVARAWRLMRGTGARAFVYVVATWALSAAVRRVRHVAVGWLLGAGSNEHLVADVDAAFKYVLDHVVEVFSVAAAPGYYFDCRKSKEEDKAGHVD